MLTATLTSLKAVLQIASHCMIWLPCHIRNASQLIETKLQEQALQN